MAHQSSLTLSLLRCIITEGTVYYDGLATNKINLDALRSNITIIPQVVRTTQSNPDHAADSVAPFSLNY